MAMALMRRIGSVRCGGSVESRAWIVNSYMRGGQRRSRVNTKVLAMGEWQRRLFTREVCRLLVVLRCQAIGGARLNARLKWQIGFEPLRPVSWCVFDRSSVRQRGPGLLRLVRLIFPFRWASPVAELSTYTP